MTLKVKRTMLTTTDNPFDPFDDAENWNRWDKDHGYHTLSLILRIARLSEQLTPQEEANEIAYAIKEIIKLFPKTNYKKVEREIEEEYEF
jgi:hypothetical protein